MIPALIGAGASIIGGLLGKKSQDRTNQINLEQSKAAQAEARRQFDLNFNEAIQARVRDAKKAGIHPLYAMGAPSTSPTAQFIPGQAQTGSHLGDGIAAAGRAIAGGALRKAQLENATLQNDLLRTQVKKAENELRTTAPEAVTPITSTTYALPSRLSHVQRDTARTQQGYPLTKYQALVQEASMERAANIEALKTRLTDHKGKPFVLTMPWGARVPIDPRRMTPAEVEEVFGEIAGAIGSTKAFADWVKSQATRLGKHIRGEK